MDKKTPKLVSKFGKPLGIMVPATLSGEKLKKTKGAGFDPARFKTQHKG